MEMPSRRSNYSLLSQFPDDQYPAGAASVSFSEPLSSEGKVPRGKMDRSFDWDSSGGGGGDHRAAASRIGNPYAPIMLQRESSGSSFAESSLSGEYYAPTLSTAGGNEIDAAFGYGHDDAYRIGGGGGGPELRMRPAEAAGGSSSGKSWAQQTEESYQLQLALALRLSSEATCADDPNFLDPVPDESTLRSSSYSSSSEAVSHRFWVNGCLSYCDRVPDGFYLISGMDPYVWTICSDHHESGRIPSIEILKSVDHSSDSSIEVVLIDRRTDPSLKDLLHKVLSISSSCITTNDIVDQLSKLVCNLMGGSASAGEDNLVSVWRECRDDIKECIGSVVMLIGSLSVGLCIHRALLFKVLADAIDLPCRIAKGCQYCKRSDASSCLVRFGLDREYLVDLIGNPGHLCEPNSLLNGPSSFSISSPLRFPRSKPSEPTIDFRSLAKQYFLDSQALNIIFDDPSAGPVYPKPADLKHGESSSNIQNSNYDVRAVGPSAQATDSQTFRLYDPSHNIMQSTNATGDATLQQHIISSGQRDARAGLASSDVEMDTIGDSRFSEESIRVSKDLSLEIEDLKIPWSDLVLRERIGAGSFGTVHRADWHGSDVAVKILMEQDFHVERFKEFLREVAIMKRLRHPNIVLFMGAVTEPPNLSIVTEYLSRGSLYRLLHKPGPREMLDERRRLSMAYDVAKGMNYLHKRKPPIVHRDLKSPNLLVDKKYTVKVGDFGLSRLKARTFLSSKSAAGTPEWMAPEVLRDEPSNEKADIYSFGVILWELATLQQPWSNLNPAQVVAAVGFKDRRLEIPRDLNPQVAALIEACWDRDPRKRPSFVSIMESLRPLIKPPVPQPSRADMPLIT
ncbi:hypothetical protein SAY87_001266 [Trapa incisa]|uniref:non-specific serine/threonine protein kinase n=1 Tax=Trapa incisa TaxID=236973 RepID=A0AAN7GIA2_9MYRT|nr:hypothetical protein SAY87_001266 [Trapa incisa]